MTRKQSIPNWLEWALPMIMIFGLAAFSGSNLSAQEGEIVKSIKVQYVGANTVSEQRILAQMSTQVGKPISLFQIDGDIKTLSGSGNVANVRILSDDAPGGVALIVVVECSPLYGGVRFEGNSVFPDRKLSKLVELSANELIDETELRKAHREILELYRKKGYSETMVDYGYGTRNESGQALVVFRIEEKSRGILRKVTFEGNTVLTPTELKAVMKQKEKGLQNIFTGGGRSDPASINEDRRAIERLYRDHGHLQARVVDVKKVPVDAKHNDLVITIDEGGAYNVSGIEISGVTALSKEQDLTRHFKTGAGKAFSESDLQDDINLIIDQYRARGYLDVKVTPQFEYRKSE